jgi:hypothetical protein
MLDFIIKRFASPAWVGSPRLIESFDDRKKRVASYVIEIDQVDKEPVNAPA